jgi:hypothetical protein
VVDVWSTGGPAYPIPFSVDQYDGLVSDVGYDVSFGTPAKSSYLHQHSSTPVLVFDSGTVHVPIDDIYDRHHPYVFWGPHYSPVYPGIPYWGATNPKRRPPRRFIKQVRQSRIHRTDYWTGGHRCMVASSPGWMGNPPRPPRSGGSWLPPNYYVPPVARFEYLDSLPIPVPQLYENRDLARGVLCDYCFYGGPTKTQLRNDFPTVGGIPNQ